MIPDKNIEEVAPGTSPVKKLIWDKQLIES